MYIIKIVILDWQYFSKIKYSLQDNEHNPTVRANVIRISFGINKNSEYTKKLLFNIFKSNFPFDNYTLVICISNFDFFDKLFSDECIKLITTKLSLNVILHQTLAPNNISLNLQRTNITIKKTLKLRKSLSYSLIAVPGIVKIVI